MRIGMLLPGVYALGNQANGVMEQARQQASALALLGHELIRLNPWRWQDAKELDVLHFYAGGPALQGVQGMLDFSKGPALIFSPIIDSNKSHAAYRAAAQLGTTLPGIFTVPGEYRRQAIGSNAVICRSNSERSRVCRGLGISPRKVHVVLNGTSLRADNLLDGETESVRYRLNLPQKFVLHLSAYSQPRKNVLRLIAAMQDLEYPLVIAGTGDREILLAQLNQAQRRTDRLQILGFVDQATRSALYALCHVFCLPSIHEGTGLAALEAAAHGAQIVITRNGGTPDYFKEFAEYTDPYSVQSIKQAVMKAWNKPRNDDLRYHVAHNLTWEASARALERIYLSCLKVRDA